jgi:hypothetical protein
MARPKYIKVNPELYKLFKRELAHHKKWMGDLFSPKGLNILFGKQKVKG